MESCEDSNHDAKTNQVEAEGRYGDSVHCWARTNMDQVRTMVQPGTGPTGAGEVEPGPPPGPR